MPQWRPDDSARNSLDKPLFGLARMSFGHNRTATDQASAAMETHQQSLFSYKPYRSLESPVPFLPMSRTEMEALHWDSCDIVLVTGDAYVDHPSFGMAIIGRLLEAQG